LYASLPVTTTHSEAQLSQMLYNHLRIVHTCLTRSYPLKDFMHDIAGICMLQNAVKPLIIMLILLIKQMSLA